MLQLNMKQQLENCLIIWIVGCLAIIMTFQERPKSCESEFFRENGDVSSFQSMAAAEESEFFRENGGVSSFRALTVESEFFRRWTDVQRPDKEISRKVIGKTALQ